MIECDNDSNAKSLAISKYDRKPGLYTIYKDERRIDQFEILAPNPIKLTEEENNELVKRMKSILLSHGIRMSIGGCGCCDSPWITFEYQGEKILDIEGRSLDMFDE